MKGIREMKGVVYREARLTEDLISVLSELSEGWEAEKITPGYYANDREHIVKNRVFLAESEGIILGYLMGAAYIQQESRGCVPKDKSCFEIEELYVVPEYRGRGIGSSLFEFACGVIKADAEYITLNAASWDWKSLLHFYIEEMGMDFRSARLYKSL